MQFFQSPYAGCRCRRVSLATACATNSTCALLSSGQTGRESTSLAASQILGESLVRSLDFAYAGCRWAGLE